MQIVHVLGILVLTCNVVVEGRRCGRKLLSDGDSYEFFDDPSESNCWMIFKKKRNTQGNLVLTCPEFNLDPRGCKRSRLIVKGSDRDTFCGSGTVYKEETGRTMKIKLVARGSAHIVGMRCIVSIQGTSSTTEPTTGSNSTSSCQCGIPRRGQRIVGGEETQVNEYPWQVLLRRSRSDFPFCGGTLISDEWVLTAAHCVIGQQPNFAYASMGEHDIRFSSESDVIDSDLSNIYIHPNYDTSTLDNDFALLQLKDKVEFDDSTVVRPACLPMEDLTTRSGQDVVVTGWGTIEFEGKASKYLQEVTLKLVNLEQCKARLNNPLSPNMFCAYEDGKDSCQGDSGGPLIYAETNFYDLIGVVSWGYGCASPDLPGVYANVYRVREWINQYVGEPTCTRPSS